jgi:putative spermidine/putrescine transport system permease protein
MAQTATIDTAATGTQIADAGNLKARLRRATARSRRNAFLLTLPLLLVLSVTFIIPILDMLWRSVDDPVVGRALTRTPAALADWKAADGLPPEAAYAAMVADLAGLRQGGGDGKALIGKFATRLNFEQSGVRSVITKTARKAPKLTEAPYKDALIKIHKKWGEPEIWAAIQRLSAPYTSVHFLASLDMRYDVDGEVVAQPEVRQVYISIWKRTLFVSGLVTLLCVLLGYPVSYLLATLPQRTSNLLIIMVLLPFWTSLLVRTTSWIVVLGQNGVLLEILAWIGLVGEEGRPQLIYNMTGTIVAMTHILLPFMILPIYSVMRGISPTYMRAGRSLGATPALAFYKVYMPLTVPGVGAGSILVFILAMGYYITPALVGGQSGTLISNFIAFHMQKSLNWGFAAALGAIMLAGVLGLYWLYDRVVGINNMKLG